MIDISIDKLTAKTVKDVLEAMETAAPSRSIPSVAKLNLRTLERLKQAVQIVRRKTDLKLEGLPFEIADEMPDDTVRVYNLQGEVIQECVLGGQSQP